MNKLEIIPAIDIINGECVRLTRGDYETKIVYDSDPVRVAKKWEGEGATRIHVVDLDGAKAGRPVNLETIRNITEAVSVPVQTGGGIRSREDIVSLLDAGVDRVILGTSLIKDPKFAREALKEFSGRIVIGLDARDGNIAVEGWTDTTAVKALQIAQTMEKFGAQRIIYTDIARDGMLEGPNLKALEQLASRISISVIASGGIAHIKHIQGILKLDISNLEGCIVGKALYTGQLSLREAISQASY